MSGRLLLCFGLALLGCRQPEEPGRSASSASGATPAPARPTEPERANAPAAAVATSTVAPPQPTPAPAVAEAHSAVAQSSAPAPAAPCTPNQDCCRRDADCVAIDAPTPCACQPCGEVMRWSLNQQGFAAYQARWARKRCVSQRCPACVGSYVGSARCSAGRCSVTVNPP